MRDPDHFAANLRFFGGSFCAQAHDDNSGANLTLLPGPVIFHSGRGVSYLLIGVVRRSSWSAKASLSLIAINDGDPRW